MFLNPLRRINIPRRTGGTRASELLMVSQIRTRARIIGLLGFPGNQTVFDIDYPAAGTGAVDTVRRTHNFVVLPTFAIGFFPGAVFVDDDTVAIGKAFLRLIEKFQTIQKVTHAASTRASLTMLEIKTRQKGIPQIGRAHV